MSVLQHADKSFALSRASFIEVVDEASVFSVQSATRRDNNRAVFESLAGAAHRDYLKLGLFDPIALLRKQLSTWLSRSTAENVILDVSTLPERIFFPILRWLVEEKKIQNLLVTYMSAATYTKDDLAFNARESAHLPTFVSQQSPEPQLENVVVGVGFLPFTLPDWLKTPFYSNRNVRISLIFPFPAEPASVLRSWEFVRRIEQNVVLDRDKALLRVNAVDISGCFDRIQKITRGGTAATVFAPYGPKPQSVAMCIAAIKMGSEVLYTHPSYYHPDYSTGVKLDQGLPAGYGYAVRLDGKDLYS